MALNVVEITTEKQFERLHDLLAQYFEVTLQCQPGAFYPSLADIHRAGHVYVARNGTTPVVACLVREDGRILWLNGAKAFLIEGAVAIFDRVYQDIGKCYGRMKNPVIRQRLFEASGTAARMDGEFGYWEPK